MILKALWRRWEDILNRRPYVFIITMAVIGFMIVPSVLMVLNIIVTFFIATAVLIVLKMTFKVERDRDIHGVQDYRFPSYHAGIASALSFTVLYYSWWLGTFFIAMAGVASYARVTSKHHTVPEVLYGFAFGMQTGFLSWFFFYHVGGAL